jgi:GNAT superfamily N-acetyltransferase
MLLQDVATGKTVGYQCYIFLGGFSKVVNVALRVDPGTRGKGIGAKFIAMGEEIVRDINPDVSAVPVLQDQSEKT